jgi:hypothetical protein
MCIQGLVHFSPLPPPPPVPPTPPPPSPPQDPAETILPLFLILFFFFYTWHAFINSLIIFLCYMVFLWIFGLFPNSKKFSKSSYKLYDPSQKCVIQCVLWFLSVFISISAIWLSTGSPFLYGIIFCNTFMFLIISSGLTWFVLMSW